MTDPGYVIEDTAEGRSLVVTGAWSAAAVDALERHDADGLVLNYARGFVGESLDFLSANWMVRRLDVLDRGLTDLEPIARLAGSLESLSVQAAPEAELDLGPLARLRSVAGEWALIGGSLGAVDDLRSVITWRFGETDLRAFRDHLLLKRLTVKEAPVLESLSGLANLRKLRLLGIHLARRLHDISDIADLGASLEDLEFESCSALSSLEDLAGLVRLRFLGLGDCGPLESLGPVAQMKDLEGLHAWGSTDIVDCDLSPLEGLPLLADLRMGRRPSYRPSVTDLVATIGRRQR